MTLILLLLSVMSLALAVPSRQATTSWTVYKNGKVYTADTTSGTDWSKNPAQSIAIQGKVIKCLGSDSEVEACVAGAPATVVDLQNKYTVLPGMHDVHMHPLEARNGVGGLCRLPTDKLPNSPEVTAQLNACKVKTPVGTKWYLGHGHSIESMITYMAAGNPDPKTILDGFFPEVPAVMLEVTSHSAWVNSAALRALGFTKDTPNPVGGLILRNANGEPNGVLLESAGNMALDAAFDINKFPELAQFADDALDNAFKVLAQNGITSIVDGRTFWGRNDDLAWERQLAKGGLTVRAILAMWAYPNFDDALLIQQLKDKFSNTKTSLLRKSNIKFYSDGLLGAYTAALLEPYIRDFYNGMIPENKGIYYFNETRLTKYLKELQNIDGKGDGYDFMIHAIGDASVRSSLNAIQNSPATGYEPRHRLTHVELIDRADISRFQQLKVIADPQVSGDWSLHESPTHKNLELRVIGKERADRSIPIKELLDGGAKITLSSDFDVNPVKPFVGMQNALNRGSQSVNLKAAIEMYTINSAFAMRQETVTGSLVVGKEADLIIVDRDIFAVSPDQISQALVLQTVLQGKQVWKSPAF